MIFHSVMNWDLDKLVGGDSEVSSHSSVIGSIWDVPSHFVDVLMAQLVRMLAGWARWLVPCLGSPVQ